jgi:hypothetical protein
MVVNELSNYRISRTPTSERFKGNLGMFDDRNRNNLEGEYVDPNGA